MFLKLINQFGMSNNAILYFIIEQHTYHLTFKDFIGFVFIFEKQQSSV